MRTESIEPWSPFKKEMNCFLSCAQYGSVTLAAERVGLTQATLTKIIQKLESDLKAQLFIRSSRGMRLTAFGTELVNSLKSAETSWRTQFAIKDLENQKTLGPITVGAHSSIASAILPKISKFIFLNHNETDFKFEFKRSIEITQKIVNSEIDLGFVINPIKNSDLIAKQIQQEFISLWSSDSNQGPLEYIFYNPEMFLGEKVLKRVKNKKLIKINDYEVIASILVNSGGVGLLPSSVAERYRLNPLSGRLQSVELNLIYRKDRFKSKFQKNFINEIHRILIS